MNEENVIPDNTLADGQGNQLLDSDNNIIQTEKQTAPDSIEQLYANALERIKELEGTEPCASCGNMRVEINALMEQNKKLDGDLKFCKQHMDAQFLKFLS